MAMKDVVSISSSVLPEAARVLGVRGTEGISRPYCFEIYLALTSDDSRDIDMADTIGAKATLTLDRDDDDTPPFVFHGILSTLELVQETYSRALFRATLVPHLWQLTLTQHSRIFTDQTIPDIIKAILEDGGLLPEDYELRLYGGYKPHEHVCQYRESHLDFISRWMEREGLYYYFEHEGSSEKLIITDKSSAHGPIERTPVRYHPVSDTDVVAGASLSSFLCRHTALPARVKLRDYDYARPLLDVSGSAPVSMTGIGEINQHAGRFFTPEEGARLAKIRAEELLARQVVAQGGGTAPFFRPGYLFELEDHPRGALNAKYLITQTEHVAIAAGGGAEIKKLLGVESDDVYRMEFKAIPAGVQYRAESRTPWPRIYGFENGTIDGEAESEYAQVDDHGRYAVKFEFDESPLKDGKASTWVRMLQPHGGGVEGWHFPLRKGVEVLFTFLGGDPDLPVIAGVVPNALNPSPVTSQNRTTNIIQTGGRNRLELEDQDGGQRVTLSTPTKNTFLRMGAPNDDSNLYLNTDGMTYLYIGEDLDLWTVGHKKEWVDQSSTEWIVGPFRTVVDNLVTETYKDKQVTTVAKGREETVTTGGYKLTVSAGGATVDITDPSTFKVHGTLLEEVDGALTQTYKAGVTQNVTGAVNQTISLDYNLTCNKMNVTNKGDEILTTLGSFIGTTISATSETTVGIKNENLIGGKIESVVGLKFEALLAANIEIHVGPHVEIKTADIKAKAAEIRTKALELWATHGPTIKQAALDLAIAAAHIRL
ncbi:hypothetical protein BE18_12920 [Sorangium cellulosum]|uniref:Gp5/Type VI secretion system Vgr protein OB-fold domain-containing protein n=1 Tax=Sorangium cellulosum TaxID=56 RepID=A0A150RRR9_SORCE|nr:hypothetical protein BE18_12920 [Sorangium cellulosum]